MSPNATDLLSTVYWLALVAARGLWLGGYRDSANPPFREWYWSDGTNASNLNCGTAGCGPWAGGEPKYVPGLQWGFVHPRARVAMGLRTPTYFTYCDYTHSQFIVPPPAFAHSLFHG